MKCNNLYGNLYTVVAPIIFEFLLIKVNNISADIVKKASVV